MNHQELLTSRAAERYLLGEMEATERDLFERHLFDCQECAEEVRAAFVLADNAKAVFAEEARAAAPVRVVHPKPRRAWFGWLQPAYAAPLAASVVLLMLTGYQSLVVIPGLRQELGQATAPRALPSVTLRSMTRGDNNLVRLAGADRFFQLSLDVNADRPFPRYQCEVQNGAGAVLFSIPAPAPPLGAPLNLLIPAQRLEAGQYTLIVRGLSAAGDLGPEVGRYPFTYQTN
jgi:hypothetical protein